MVFLHIDNEGYLYGISYGEIRDGEKPNIPCVDNVDKLDLSGVRMCAHRWDGKKLVLDNDRLAKLQKAEEVGSQQEHINDLKAKLSATDYVVIKIAEGVATAQEYADVISQRQAWRAEINRLEAICSE